MALALACLANAKPMIRKIKVQDLTLGMYIQDLNCEWMDHSFLRNHFMLRHEGDLEQIRSAGIRELYIDTLKGIDVPSAPSVTEVQADLLQGMLRSMDRAGVQLIVCSGHSALLDPPRGNARCTTAST